MAEEKENNHGITITPSEFELNIQRGETLMFKSQIVNNSNKDLNVEVFAKDLNIVTYTSQNILNLIDPNTLTSSPSSWMSIQSSKTQVPANSIKEFIFSITIPKEAKISEFYPVIQYTFIDSKELNNNKVGVRGEAVSVIKLNLTSSEVLGASVRKRGVITELKVKDYITFLPSNTFSITIQNSGDTFYVPRGKISIFNSKGIKVSPEAGVNDKFESLLPAEKSSESLEWSSESPFKIIPDFGKYTVRAEVFMDGDQSNPLISETSFFILPVYHIVGFILLIGISFLLIKRIPKKKQPTKKTLFTDLASS